MELQHSYIDLLNPDLIDLSLIMNHGKYEEDIKEMLHQKTNIQPSISSTLDDLFVKQYFKQRNTQRCSRTNNTFLFFGLTKISSGAGSKWVHILEKKLKITPDQYKKGIWNFSFEGEAKVNPILLKFIEEEASLVANPNLARLKDWINYKEKQTESLTESLFNQAGTLRSEDIGLPSIATITADEHLDFYLCSLIGRKEMAYKIEPARVAETLNSFHRSPKKHGPRHDIEVSYPFMDSEQKEISKSLEDRKLAMVHCQNYSDTASVLHQLIIQSLEQGERILVLSDRYAFLENLFSELPINQKIILNQNWSDEPVLKKILKSSIDKALISNKPDARSYKLHKQQTNRQLSRLEQYATEMSQATFGPLKWIELIGHYMENQLLTDKSILSAQLNSANFEFNHTEYKKLLQTIENLWPSHEKVDHKADHFSIFRDELFTKTGKHQSKKIFMDAAQKFKEAVDTTRKDLQNIINHYSELYRDQLDNCYLNLNKATIALMDKIQDAQAEFGSNFLLHKSRVSSMGILLSKQAKKEQQTIKTIINDYKELQELTTTGLYQERPIKDLVYLKNIKSIFEQLDLFKTDLENWRQDSLTIIQTELKRFSKKHHINHDGLKQNIIDLEARLKACFKTFKALQLFKDPPHDYLLTYPKRLNQFNALALEVEKLYQDMESFDEIYEWTRKWLLLSKKEQELIQGLIDTKTGKWQAAFKSWYFNKVIERNLSGDKLLDKDSIEKAIQQIIDHYPLLLQQINDKWHSDLAQQYNQLSRKLRKKLEKQPLPTESDDTLHQKEIQALFQTAFPLMFSSTKNWEKQAQGAFKFDRVLILEHEEVSSELYQSICPKVESLILFTFGQTQNPNGLAYHLDQMPLVRKRTMRGKYFSTCLKLSHKAPYYTNRPFARQIDLHCTQGVFDPQTRLNDKEVDKVMHLLNTIEIDKSTRIYPKTGILCFTEAQRNQIWSYINELSARKDSIGEKVRQLERNGLQVGFLSDLMGYSFNRLIISTTFSAVDMDRCFIDPFEFVNSRNLLLGINWCKYNKATHIDLVYSSIPNNVQGKMDHNPGGKMVIQFIEDFEQLEQGTSHGGSHYFNDFDQEFLEENKFALRLQEMLRQYYPLNQLRLDYELFGLEFPLCILPENLESKATLLVFDKIISTEKQISFIWDNYYANKLNKAGFPIVHINTTDFWKSPETALNILLDKLKAIPSQAEDIMN